MEDGDDVRRRHQPPQQLTFEIVDASDGGGGGGAGHDSDGSSVGGTQNQFAGAHLPDLGKLSGEGSDTAADLQAEYEDATQDLVCCGRFPKAVPFLIGQEFCERFSYYGLRAILVLYFTNFFNFSDSRATVLYHLFILLSYLTSAFGGVLADSSLGKFKTILYLSIVYCAGNTIMSFTAIPSVAGHPPNPAGAMIGLLLIAIGTGGIKPCVSSFGGDQFKSSQQHLLQTFFAAFYFSINAGSTLSMIITPKLRADVQCYGQDECYPVAFGLPAVLMALATVVFIMGRRLYHEYIPERNVILDFVRVLKIAIAHKLGRQTPLPTSTPFIGNDGGTGDGGGSGSGSAGQGASGHAAVASSRKAHWLDPARAHYGDAFVNDVKQVLSVFVVFIPSPFFWTLFDQQGSRWTLQAEQMRMFDMGPLGRFRPDQMQAANAILVLMLIPVFERFVYPALKRLRIPHSPLQRMIAGMLLCGLAFVVSGLLQVRIDASRPDLSVRSGYSNLRVTNLAGADASVLITDSTPLAAGAAAAGDGGGVLSAVGAGGVGDEAAAWTRVGVVQDNETLSDGGAGQYTRVPTVGATVVVTVHKGIRDERYVVSNLTLDKGTRHSLHVYRDTSNSSSADVLTHVLTSDHSNRHWVDPDDEDDAVTEAAQDAARIKFLNLTPLSLRIARPKTERTKAIVDALAPRNSTTYPLGVFDSGKVGLLIQESDNGTAIRNLTLERFVTEDGADYTATIRWNGTAANIALLTDVPGNSVSVLLQLPQYLVVSCGEILFSITGLEFAFSEAPGSMKAVVQAGWLITTALGSLIVIIVAESSFFSKQRDEFFFFAGLMGVVCLLFVYIATGYRYRNPLYREPSSSSSSKRREGSRDTTPLIGDSGDSSEQGSTSFA